MVMNICKSRARRRSTLFDPYVQAPVLAQEVESVLTENAGELSTVKVVASGTRDFSWLDLAHDARLVVFLLR